MTKKNGVNVTLHAQRDIKSIWSYISQENPLNANDFIYALEEEILSLAVFPERNPIIPEGRILQTSEYRHLIYKNYRIVYRFDDLTVYVLRVFHGARLLDVAAVE